MVHLGLATQHMPGHGGIKNHPHQHAFTIVGTKHLFGVHMTQYHCEIHKYQIILRFSISETYHDELNAARAEHPDEFFVLCNAEGDENAFTIPSLGGGQTTTFLGNIFHGIPPLPDPEPPHFFPWASTYCRAMIPDVEVTVERLALYRPFRHTEVAPKYANYWMFGEGDEAHLTNLQTAGLSSGPLEGDPQLYGTDIDTVLSLTEAPDWLGQDQLRAGVPLSAPHVPHRDPGTGHIHIPHETPFEKGQSYKMLYRGIGEPQMVTAGPTFLYCAVVNNGPTPEAWPYPDGPCVITPMPEKYLKPYPHMTGFCR